jgi:membrane protease YdiL (CAAX protease family)
MAATVRPHGLREQAAFWLSRRSSALLELVLVSLVIIFSVFQPLLILVLAGLSLWLRRQTWREIGLGRPSSGVMRTIAAGTVLATAWTGFSLFILRPVTQALAGQPLNLDQFAGIRGNVGALGLWLLLTWTLAAFGEEIAFRAYLIRRAADALGTGIAGLVAGVLLAALLFGAGHRYQGLPGVIDNVFLGLLLGGLYLWTGRNLWLSILVHGFGNTLGFLALYFGWFGLA